MGREQREMRICTLALSSVLSPPLYASIDCYKHIRQYNNHYHQPHSQWPSFSGRRCSCLEQSSRTRHLRTFRGCLLVPSEDPSFLHLLSNPLVCIVLMFQCFGDAKLVHATYLLTHLLSAFVSDIQHIRGKDHKKFLHTTNTRCTHILIATNSASIT